MANFLNVIDETLWTIEPESAKSERDLASIIGRPLAVTRINVAIDLRGEAQVDQAFYKTFTPDTDQLLQDSGSLEGFTWPVRFGSQALRHDGTIGYFADNDYTTFNAVHVPSSVTPSTTPYVKKIGAGNYVDLAVRPEVATDGPAPFDRKGSQYLTLLLDPNGSVNAATGLLPSLEVSLDARFVDAAREAMAVTFRTGPLLLGPETIRIPLPAVSSGEWSWLQSTGTSVGDWQGDSIGAASTAPQLDGQPSILREGWLRFSRTDT